MSYYTHRFPLMVSSKAGRLQAPIQLFPREIPGAPLGLPKGDRACQQQGWDKVTALSQEPCSALTFPGGYYWLQQRCMDTYLPGWREYIFAAGENNFSGCTDGPSPSHGLCSQAPSDTHPGVPCYDGALQHPSDLPITSSPGSSSSALRVTWVLCLWLSGVARHSCLVFMLSHPCWIIFHSSLWE